LPMLVLYTITFHSFANWLSVDDKFTYVCMYRHDICHRGYNRDAESIWFHLSGQIQYRHNLSLYRWYMATKQSCGI